MKNKIRILEELSVKKNSRFKVFTDNDKVTIINLSYNLQTFLGFLLLFLSYFYFRNIVAVIIICAFLITATDFYKIIQTTNKVVLDLTKKTIEISNTNIIGKLKLKQLIFFDNIVDITITKRRFWAINGNAEVFNRLILNTNRTEINLLDLTFRNYDKDIDPDSLREVLLDLIHNK